MQKILSDSHVQKIDELNNKLIAIEGKIYHLVKKEYQIAEKEFKRKKEDEGIVEICSERLSKAFALQDAITFTLYIESVR